MKKPTPLRACTLLLATALMASPVFAISPRAFVETASEQGLAEIENGKLAVQKSRSADVRQFAQMMIDDHQATNQELAALARQLTMHPTDNAAMLDRVKKLILEYRDGSFDRAYINNQVRAHEQTVELFREQAQDPQTPVLQEFAGKVLPKLEAHLEQARKLQANHP